MIRIVLLLILSLTFSCSSSSQYDGPPKLSSITLIDSNGFTETITSKDRLDQYQNVDFEKAQSYQKVLRVYSRDSSGNIEAKVNSYHPTGQLKQSLHAINNCANGSYCEWHPNGQKKVEAIVINGIADLTPAAEKSWVFDHTCTITDEEGHLAATIEYNKGLLEGTSLYYHPNGKIWKRIPYKNDLIQGTYEIFLENGEPLQTYEYRNNLKHGIALRYWPGGKIAAQEHYEENLLVEGHYYDVCSAEVAQVMQGNGYRAVFTKDGLAELQEYRHGIQEGEVKVFDPEKTVVNVYKVKEGFKHGEEIEYYDKKLGCSTVKPKILVTWYQGIIQGLVKTWYENGVMESQREISNNKKNGLATAWYRDGTLMMIEEYAQDILVRGEYYKNGEKKPVSQVWEGSGIASMYDPEGNFIRKINYHNGKPQE